MGLGGAVVLRWVGCVGQGLSEGNSGHFCQPKIRGVTLVDDAIYRPNLILGIPESFPENWADEALAELQSTGADTGILRTSEGPFAGIELYLPTAVGIFILSGFFNGFLSKMGEDSYAAVKRGAKALYKKARLLTVRTIASAPGKARNTGYSMVFAIGCELLPTLRVKLLIPIDASIQEVEEAIDNFLDLMLDVHTRRVNRKIIDDLLIYPPVSGMILVTFNPDLGKIVAVDGLANTPAAT